MCERELRKLPVVDMVWRGIPTADNQVQDEYIHIGMRMIRTKKERAPVPMGFYALDIMLPPSLKL